MSIATQIERIKTAKNKIRAKLVALGLATETDNIDTLATTVDGITDNGAVSAEILEGSSYTIPAGYHNGSGVVKAVTDSTGDAERYKTQQKTVTPSKSQQSVTSDDGYYALESVTVEPIPAAYQDVTGVTATADKVLAGYKFVDAMGSEVVGSMSLYSGEEFALDAETTEHTLASGFYEDTRVYITPEEKSATPTKAAQDITPSAGKVLSKVTVNPIPDAYQDVRKVTATADTVLENHEIVLSDGSVVSGMIKVRGSQVGTIDGLEESSVTFEEGYYTGITVSLTGDIEAALAEI